MSLAFKIDETGRLVAVDPEHVADALGRDGAHYWVDLGEVNDQELGRWLQALRIPPFLVQLAQTPSPSLPVSTEGVVSASAALDEGVYFVFPVFGSEDPTVTEQFAGICVPGCLLTFHRKPLPALLAAAQLAQQGSVLQQASVSGLMSALAGFWVNRSRNASVSLVRRLAALSTRMRREGDVDEDDLTELLTCDDALQVLAAVVDEQVACLQRLAVAQSRALGLKQLADQFSVAITNLEGLARSIDRLERRADSLRAQYDSRMAERTNRRLAALTVLSAVFMPMTLIAGIYGMNFEFMPELHHRLAYPFALGGMIGVATLMVLFFWKRGWFS